MTEKQNRLLNSITVNGFQLKNNNLVSEELKSEMNTPKKYFTKENIEYNINRAREGAETITVGVHSIDIGAKNNNIGFSYDGADDSFQYISEVGQMIDRIHDYGTRVFVPLTIKDYSNSNKRDELFEHDLVIEMENISKAFVRAALIAKIMGYDGIQINAVQEGYLLKQFSKSFCYFTSGDSGISLDTSLKFAADIVKGIKNVCGSDFPVTLRFGVKSFVDTLKNETEWESSADIKLEEIPEAIEAIKELAFAGYDALDIDAGAGNSWCLTNEPSFTECEGFFQEIRCNEDNSSKPLFGYSIIENKELAKKVLAKGIYDGISMEQFLFTNINSDNKTLIGSFENTNSYMS